MISTRDEVLEDTFWSPWPRRSSPWSWSLQVLENAMSSAEDRLFLNLLKMGPKVMTIFFFVLEHAKELAQIYEDLFLFFFENVWISRKICDNFVQKPFFFWFYFILMTPKISRKICHLFARRHFFGDHLLVVSLVLGLEHSCPWPREGLSSESRSLVSVFFFFLS